MDTKTNLIDTHCHLEAVENLPEALSEAKNAGLSGIVAVGEDFESNQKILEIAQGKYPVKIYPALGLHPGKVSDENFGKTIEQIEKNADKIAAVGETGLDFWIPPAKKNKVQRELQIKSFLAQIEIAKKYDLALSIHSRGAWQEAFDTAKNAEAKKCIFHWYSGPLDVLELILKAGYYISATPALEYSVQLIEAIKITPIEKILIETDSPVTYKPRTGIYKARPKDLTRTLKALADIKQISTEEAVTVCGETAKSLLKTT